MSDLCQLDKFIAKTGIETDNGLQTSLRILARIIACELSNEDGPSLQEDLTKDHLPALLDRNKKRG